MASDVTYLEKLMEENSNVVMGSLEIFLSELGYKIFEGQNAFECLKLLNHINPNLVNEFIGQLETANGIINSLVKTAEVKGKYMEGHAERVSLYAVKVGRLIGMSDMAVRELAIAGLIHDIGKVGISDEILNKNSALTNSEFKVIMQHPVYGDSICAPIKSLKRIKSIVRHHHEKLNGTGYPDGLRGCQINLSTRIVTVVDIYDALTSHRSYRKAMSRDTAFCILRKCVDEGEIDPYVVDVLKNVIDVV